MASHVAIAPGVSCCKADDRIIFLDLNRERYFQLSEIQTGWFEELMSQSPAQRSMPAQQLGTHLQRMGLISMEAVACQPTRPPYRAASASLQDYPLKAEGRLRMSRLPDIGWSVAATAFDLKVRGLRAVLDLHAAGKVQLRKTGRAREAGADEIVGQFFAWSPALFTSHDACLFRSLALARYLRSRRYVSDIIIGVRSQPFRAHCWVQRGDRVLNEHLESARNYCPVLIV